MLNTKMEVRVIDTNVILNTTLEGLVTKYDLDGRQIYIVIPFKVVMELDKFKNGIENINYNSRQSIRYLEEMRKIARANDCLITDGIEVTDRILLKVHVTPEDIANIDITKPDNSIVKAAKDLSEDETNSTKLVSEDLHIKIIADILGVESESFEIDINSDKDIYKGIEEIDIDDLQVNELYIKKEIKATPEQQQILYMNEMVICNDSVGGVHYGIYNNDTKKIKLLKDNIAAWGIRPRKLKTGEINYEQAFLMNVLMNPKINFVSAIGPSGVGKTLVTMACALQQTLKLNLYNKIVVMRPLVSIGKDIGSLPGDKLEKLSPWMASTFDALEFLLDSDEYDIKDSSFDAKDRVYELIECNQLELEAMQFIRGRSIPNQFIIVDDAQNLTPHEAAAILTRAADGTKIVFLGDISKKQIDNHKLNTLNNGLSYVVNRFKGASDEVAHITFDQSSIVRSNIASLAVELL